MVRETTVISCAGKRMSPWVAVYSITLYYWWRLSPLIHKFAKSIPAEYSWGKSLKQYKVGVLCCWMNLYYNHRIFLKCINLHSCKIQRSIQWGQILHCISIVPLWNQMEFSFFYAGSCASKDARVSIVHRTAGHSWWNHESNGRTKARSEVGTESSGTHQEEATSLRVQWPL